MKNQALTLEELEIGRQKALANATELISDAEVLIANGRWARALFLAQIAGEEIGKHIIILNAAVELLENAIDWKSFWRIYRQHSAKQKTVMFADIMFSLRGDVQEELKAFPAAAADLESGKMLSLYSDFLEGRFVSPSDCIDPDMPRNAVKWARGRLAMMNTLFKSIASLDKLTQDGIARSKDSLRRRLKDMDASDEMLRNSPFQ